MKKLGYKTKVILTTLWVALISFSSKVMAITTVLKVDSQSDYGVLNPKELNPLQSESIIIAITTKIILYLLIAITVVVGIMSFIKIRKIEDKDIKKKKIKNAIIIVSILVSLIIAIIISSILFTGHI